MAGGLQSGNTSPRRPSRWTGEGSKTRSLEFACVRTQPKGLRDLLGAGFARYRHHLRGYHHCPRALPNPTPVFLLRGVLDRTFEFEPTIENGSSGHDGGGTRHHCGMREPGEAPRLTCADVGNGCSCLVRRSALSGKPEVRHVNMPATGQLALLVRMPLQVSGVRVRNRWSGLEHQLLQFVPHFLTRASDTSMTTTSRPRAAVRHQLENLRSIQLCGTGHETSAPVSSKRWSLAPVPT